MHTDPSDERQKEPHLLQKYKSVTKCGPFPFLFPLSTDEKEYLSVFKNIIDMIKQQWHMTTTPLESGRTEHSTRGPDSTKARLAASPIWEAGTCWVVPKGRQAIKTGKPGLYFYGSWKGLLGCRQHWRKQKGGKRVEPQGQDVAVWGPMENLRNQTEKCLSHTRGQSLAGGPASLGREDASHHVGGETRRDPWPERRQEAKYGSSRPKNQEARAFFRMGDWEYF